MSEAVAMVDYPNLTLKQLKDFREDYILKHDYFQYKASPFLAQTPKNSYMQDQVNALKELQEKLKAWFKAGNPNNADSIVPDAMSTVGPFMDLTRLLAHQQPNVNQPRPQVIPPRPPPGGDGGVANNIPNVNQPANPNMEVDENRQEMEEGQRQPPRIQRRRSLRPGEHYDENNNIVDENGNLVNDNDPAIIANQEATTGVVDNKEDVAPISINKIQPIILNTVQPGTALSTETSEPRLTQPTIYNNDNVTSNIDDETIKKTAIELGRDPDLTLQEMKKADDYITQQYPDTYGTYINNQPEFEVESHVRTDYTTTELTKMMEEKTKQVYQNTFPTYEPDVIKYNEIDLVKNIETQLSDQLVDINKVVTIAPELPETYVELTNKFEKTIFSQNKKLESVVPYDMTAATFPKKEEWVFISDYKREPDPVYGLTREPSIAFFELLDTNAKRSPIIDYLLEDTKIKERLLDYGNYYINYPVTNGPWQDFIKDLYVNLKVGENNDKLFRKLIEKHEIVISHNLFYNTWSGYNNFMRLIKDEDNEISKEKIQESLDIAYEMSTNVFLSSAIFSCMATAITIVTGGLVKLAYNRYTNTLEPRNQLMGIGDNIYQVVPPRGTTYFMFRPNVFTTYPVVNLFNNDGENNQMMAIEEDEPDPTLLTLSQIRKKPTDQVVLNTNNNQPPPPPPAVELQNDLTAQKQNVEAEIVPQNEQLPQPPPTAPKLNLRQNDYLTNNFQKIIQEHRNIISSPDRINIIGLKDRINFALKKLEEKQYARAFRQWNIETKQTLTNKIVELKKMLKEDDYLLNNLEKYREITTEALIANYVPKSNSKNSLKPYIEEIIKSIPKKNMNVEPPNWYKELNLKKPFLFKEAIKDLDQQNIMALRLLGDINLVFKGVIHDLNNFLLDYQKYQNNNIAYNARQDQKLPLLRINAPNNRIVVNSLYMLKLYDFETYNKVLEILQSPQNYYYKLFDHYGPNAYLQFKIPENFVEPAKKYYDEINVINNLNAPEENVATNIKPTNQQMIQEPSTAGTSRALTMEQVFIPQQEINLQDPQVQQTITETIDELVPSMLNPKERENIKNRITTQFSIPKTITTLIEKEETAPNTVVNKIQQADKINEEIDPKYRKTTPLPQETNIQQPGDTEREISDADIRNNNINAQILEEMNDVPDLLEGPTLNDVMEMTPAMINDALNTYPNNKHLLQAKQSYYDEKEMIDYQYTLDTQKLKDTIKRRTIKEIINSLFTGVGQVLEKTAVLGLVLGLPASMITIGALMNEETSTFMKILATIGIRSTWAALTSLAAGGVKVAISDDLTYTKAPVDISNRPMSEIEQITKTRLDDWIAWSNGHAKNDTFYNYGKKFIRNVLTGIQDLYPNLPNLTNLPVQRANNLAEVLTKYEIEKPFESQKAGLLTKVYERNEEKINELKGIQYSLRLKYDEYISQFYLQKNINKSKINEAANELGLILKSISAQLYNNIPRDDFQKEYYEQIFRIIDKDLTNIILKSEAINMRVNELRVKDEEKYRVIKNSLLNNINHPGWESFLSGSFNDPAFDLKNNPLISKKFKSDATINDLINIMPELKKHFNEEEAKETIEKATGTRTFTIFKNQQTVLNKMLEDYVTFKGDVQSSGTTQRTYINNYLVWRSLQGYIDGVVPNNLKNLLINDPFEIVTIRSTYGTERYLNTLAEQNQALNNYLWELETNKKEINKELMNEFYSKSVWTKYLLAQTSHTFEESNPPQDPSLLQQAKEQSQSWLNYVSSYALVPAATILAGYYKLPPNPADKLLLPGGYQGMGRHQYNKHKAWDLLINTKKKSKEKLPEIGCGLCGSDDNLYKICKNSNDIMCNRCIKEGKLSKFKKIPQFLKADNITSIEDDPQLKEMKNNKLKNLINEIYNKNITDQHFEKSYDDQTKEIPTEMYAKGLMFKNHDLNKFSQDELLNKITKLYMKIDLNKANDNEQYNYLKLVKHYIKKYGLNKERLVLNLNNIRDFTKLKEDFLKDPSLMLKIEFNTNTDI